MNRATRTWISVVALALLAAQPGCEVEVDDQRDRHLTITGKVTYHGVPLKKGAIHFLPVDPANPSASGQINEGKIQDVFTRTPGDGINSGKYKITVTSFDEAFLESVAKRDAQGPDPTEVARAANQIKTLIPHRYNNVRESGLRVEFSLANQSLDLDLVD